MKTGIAIGAVIVVVALVVSLVPLKEVAYAVTVDYEDTETYYENEPLEYRELDSSIIYGAPEFDVEEYVDTRYGLAHKLVAQDYALSADDYALCVIVQNLDDAGGTFETHYTLTTADKEAAERQKNLIQRTTDEWQELDREYYEGTVELYLEPGQVGAFICPSSGIYIALDRVPFDHSHDIVPATIQLEKQRTVTRQRQETRYKKVDLLEYLLHYR